MNYTTAIHQDLPPLRRRKTVKKRVIVEQLRKMKTHPTATELTEVLQENGEDVSRATVFRVLSSLADEGVIRRVEVENSDTRYDGNINPHYHFICRICGKVEDIDLPYLAELDEKMREDGYDIEGHSMEFYGICSECGQKIKIPLAQ